MLELFALGTVGFWIFLTVSIILLTWCLEIENGWGATFTFVAVIAAFFYFGNSELFSSFFSFIKNNPGKTIGVAAGYFVAGAIWSIFKWYFFVLDKRDYHEREMARRDSHNFEIPIPGDYKSTIIMWMSYWPISAPWTLINNPVKRIFNRIYINLGGVYTRISNHIFKDLIAAQNQKKNEK